MSSDVSSVISSVLSAYYGTTKSSTTTTDSTTEESTASSAYSNKTSLGRYFNSTSTDDVSAKTIFEKLSIDIGGGGKTITEDQLNKYIKSAKAGTITLPDEELNALTDLQNNWDKIADGADSITYSSIVASGNKDTLLAMAPAEEDDSAISDLQDACNEATIAAYSKVVNAAFGGSTSKDSSGLTSLLNTLLSGTTDKDDDKNADMIATLTNLLAEYDSSSTIEVDA